MKIKQAIQRGNFFFTLGIGFTIYDTVSHFFKYTNDVWPLWKHLIWPIVIALIIYFIAFMIGEGVYHKRQTPTGLLTKHYEKKMGL